MNHILNEIEIELLRLIKEVNPSLLQEAMGYSLIAPGKKIRPLLMLLVLKSYGMDYHKYISIACAIEMMHTSSLIHDDLPALDNDDLRRGRPTSHKKFNEATAILAGDALMIEVFNVIVNSDISDREKVYFTKVLSEASGANGMLLGQQNDILFEDQDVELDQLLENYILKTGKLIQAPLLMGSFVAKEEDSAIWKEIGYKIGLAFQIQDDLLDVTSTTEELGKNANSDLENHKSTIVSILGNEEAQKLVNQYITDTLTLIYSLQINHGIFLEIIDDLMKRSK